MYLEKFTLILMAMVAMVSVAVRAAVIAHRDSIERTPADNFLSAVTISFGKEHVGSGVILNKRWIITSARCLENYTTPKHLRIHFGSNDRNDMNQTIRKVEEIITHPSYKQQRLVNNVALLKVRADIEFGPMVQAAFLPTSETQEDELAYAIGWEKVDQMKPRSATETLKFYQTTVMALDLCWERLEDLDAVKVNDNVICTYGADGDSFIAMDHGSALVSIDKNELIGIASWNEKGYPNIYARIGSNLPWIKPIIAL